MSEEEQAQRRAQEEEQIRLMLSQLLDPQARERRTFDPLGSAGPLLNPSFDRSQSRASNSLDRSCRVRSRTSSLGWLRGDS